MTNDTKPLLECPHCHKMVKTFIDHIPKEHDPIRKNGKWVFEKDETPDIPVIPDVTEIPYIPVDVPVDNKPKIQIKKDEKKNDDGPQRDLAEKLIKESKKKSDEYYDRR